MTTAVSESPSQVLVEQDLKRTASRKEIRNLLGMPGQFRSWLEAQQDADAECVGYAHRTDMCPLATWLRETTVDYTIEISTSRVTWRLGKMSLQGWMSRFVCLIDRTYPTERDITAAGALRVLSTIDSLHDAGPALTASMPEAALV